MNLRRERRVNRAVACFVLLLSFAKVWSAPPSLKFIENKGQWPSHFDYRATIRGGFLGIEKGKFSYAFLDYRKINSHHLPNDYHESNQSDFNNSLCGHLVETNFLGSNLNSKVSGFGITSDYFNFYLKGPDQWRSDVHAYEGMIYSSFYTGIDLKVYSSGENMKYDFVVSPGADIEQIQWKYSGEEVVQLINGEISIKSSLANITEMKPMAYQIINGRKVFVKCNYSLCDGVFSFSVDDYNKCEELVVDPLLIFSTYSGFTADNWGSSATPGEHGTLYSSGVVNLFNVGGTFPATPGSFQTHYGGIYDVAIYKYDSTGQQLLYTSYLGGSKSETPHSMVIDADNNLLVLGTTSSSDFPTTSGAQGRTYSGGIPIDQFQSREMPIPYETGSDIFVVKISPDGKNLLASTFLGGTNNDGLNPNLGTLVQNYGDQMRGDIIADKLSGDIFISTVTSSPDFNAINSFNTTYRGGDTDALVVRLKNDLSSVIWSALIGGVGADASHTIQIDAAGDIYVAGGTTSIDFPVTASVYQSSLAGNADGWLAKIKGDGSQIINCTLTGTSSFDEVFFLDIDQDENVYVYGQTSGSFPISSGVYSNPGSGQFLQKFDNTLSALIFSTVFGSGIGIPNISPTAFLVNDCGNIYMSGWGGKVNSAFGYWVSTTFGMPVTSDAIQKTPNGSDFYFIVLAPNATKLLYATYLGGAKSGTHVDGGTCRFDKHGIVYHSVCAGCAATTANRQPASDFPTTPHAWSRMNGSGNCNNAAFKLDLSSLTARIQTNSVTLDGVTRVCMDDKIVFQNNSIGGQHYDWDLGDGTKFTKLDTLSLTHQYLAEGQYKVKLKAVDLGTCTKVDSTSILINVFNRRGFAGPDQTICFNTGAQLMAGGGGTYQWTSSDNTFTSDQAQPQVNPPATTKYFISITDVNGCVVMDTINLKVIPGLDIKMKLERQFDCLNRPVLVASNLSDPTENLFFDFGDGSTSDEQNVIHEYQKDSTYVVRLWGENEGCRYQQAENVAIYQLLVPNVFTPDQSPPLNDYFKIKLGERVIIPGAEPPTQISIRIYNRWGKQVYENPDYRNDWAAKEVDAGVYYYTVLLEGKTCKGWVQVVK